MGIWLHSMLILILRKADQVLLGVWGVLVQVGQMLLVQVQVWQLLLRLPLRLPMLQIIH